MGVQHGRENFVALVQMSQVGPAVITANVAVAIGIHRQRVLSVTSLLDTDFTKRGWASRNRTYPPPGLFPLSDSPVCPHP